MKHVLFIYCLFLSTIAFAQVEICDNGIDDDFDLLIDLNDDDCDCEVVAPVSLVPNPSFEDINCCPDNKAQLKCATGWIQASAPTTDFIHTCDYMGPTLYPPPQPFPDGKGIVGFRNGLINTSVNANYKEYAGACLLSPLLKDSLYRFEFDVGFSYLSRSPPIDITFFGTSDCSFLPFGVGNIQYGCPSKSRNWKELKSVNVSSATGSEWVKAFIEIIPDEDIYAIAIGPSCDPFPATRNLYYYLDNLLLSDLSSFQLRVTEAGDPCTGSWSLQVPENSNFQYQWYKDGNALIGESTHKLSQQYGDGQYQVRIIHGGSCRVSKEFELIIPRTRIYIDASICAGDIYPFGNLNITQSGTYLDTLTGSDGCDSIVSIGLKVINTEYDTVEVSMHSGQSFKRGGFEVSEEGKHDITLTSASGCDLILTVFLDYFEVYIPNVFGPNFGPDNSVFKPFAAQGIIAKSTIFIYDRWGGLIHQGEEWDGLNADAGVYVYYIKMEFFEGEPHEFSGDVTLMK